MITLGSGRQIPLGAYVRGIKACLAAPTGTEYSYGLTSSGRLDPTPRETIDCDKPLQCKAGGPAEYEHRVRVGGGYGHKSTGLAFYYFCADCHGSEDHKDMDMAMLVECIRRS